MQVKVGMQGKTFAILQAMKINLLGAGRVAWHLAPSLQRAGHQVVGICARHLEHAQALAGRLTDALAVTSVGQLPAADWYLLSVSDASIAPLAAELAALPLPPEAVVAHTAGSVPLQVLATCHRRAAVIYPMQTFSKERHADLQQATCFVEATDERTLLEAEALARGIVGHVARLDSTDRRHLHLAAVFACNFANHCYHLAYHVLEEAGIDPRCLLPLIDETAAKVHEMHPAEAQTGPAVRGDRLVLQRQSHMLEGKPDVQRIYQEMSASIAQLQASHPHRADGHDDAHGKRQETT